jgi:hypothetical protein
MKARAEHSLGHSVPAKRNMARRFTGGKLRCFVGPGGSDDSAV